MSYASILKKEAKIRLESLGDDIKKRRDKDFFWPTGTQVYVGRQGSGKTISAVYHLHKLKERYPKAIIVSNVQLHYYEPVQIDIENPDAKSEGIEWGSLIDCENEYISFSSMEELGYCLTKINNDHYGVIYVIDEIHTYFNALDSKNIPMYVFTEISQQRKQRKLIIGTSQLFLRMAKPLREQCDSLIVCTTRLGVWTKQKAYDGMTIDQDYDGKLSGTVKKTGWFFHNRKIRNSFDTFQKVVSGSEQYEQIQRIELTSGKQKRFSIRK